MWKSSPNGTGGFSRMDDENLPADREGLAAPMPVSAARVLNLLAKLAPAFEP